jgi:hypothetical protein
MSWRTVWSPTEPDLSLAPTTATERARSMVSSRVMMQEPERRFSVPHDDRENPPCAKIVR